MSNWAVFLLISRSASTLSTLTLSLSRWNFALFIISSDIPSMEAIAKAFDLPGMPIMSLYVGFNVATSNSHEAFSTSGV